MEYFKEQCNKKMHRSHFLVFDSFYTAGERTFFPGVGLFKILTSFLVKGGCSFILKLARVRKNRNEQSGSWYHNYQERQLYSRVKKISLRSNSHTTKSPFNQISTLFEVLRFM